jgi:hypothetical protein
MSEQDTFSLLFTARKSAYYRLLVAQGLCYNQGNHKYLFMFFVLIMFCSTTAHFLLDLMSLFAVFTNAYSIDF